MNHIIHRRPIRIIKEVVSEHFAVPVADLEGDCREQRVVGPRHMAMFLASELLKISNVQIGEAFGKRDPSSVRSAVDNIRTRLPVNSALRYEAGALIRKYVAASMRVVEPAPDESTSEYRLRMVTVLCQREIQTVQFHQDHDQRSAKLAQDVLDIIQAEGSR